MIFLMNKSIQLSKDKKLYVHQISSIFYVTLKNGVKYE